MDPSEEKHRTRLVRIVLRQKGFKPSWKNSTVWVRVEKLEWLGDNWRLAIAVTETELVHYRGNMEDVIHDRKEKLIEEWRESRH